MLEAVTRRPARRTTATLDREVTIRLASPGDLPGTVRVAERDTRPVPQSPVLVAVCEGEIVAALSLRDGQAAADPFRPTADIVALLRCRAGQHRHGAMRPASWSRPRVAGDLGLAGGRG